MKTRIRTSDIMLMAAGAFLVIMLLTSVITARIILDRSVVIRQPDRGVVYVQNVF